MKQKINTSIKLIEQAAAERWIKSLALFHMLKSTYGNSVIYNYRKRMKELSERFGIAIKTLYNYLDILRSKELIDENKGNSKNLHLASIRKLTSYKIKKKCKITISTDDDLQIISCKLYYKLIENHFRKMAFKRALKEYGKRNLNKMESSETASTPFSLSIRNAAKLLSINEKSVIEVLQTLQDLNMLKLYRQKSIKISEKKLPVNLLKDYPGHKFITRRGTFLQFGSKIELLEYPVIIPKISTRIYAKCYKSIQCKKYHN